MWYIDSSAIIKLIKPEKESAALTKKLPSALIASRISRVEVTRTIIRYEPDLLDATYDVLADIQMVPVEDAIVTIAENLPQFIELRSLDSLHIASALAINDAVVSIISCCLLAVNLLKANAMVYYFLYLIYISKL